jgi:WD40 repeat protein
VKVFDLRNGKLAAHVRDIKEEVDGLGVSPDGRYLGHAAPHACQIRRLGEWEPVCQINHGNDGVVNSVDFARDSTMVASAGNYGHVLVTRTSDWSLVGDGLIANTSSIKSVRISPDQRYVAAGYGGANAVVVWKVADMSLARHHSMFYIEAVAWSGDCRYLFAGGRDDQGRLRVFRTSDWTAVADPLVQADRSNIEYIDVYRDLIAIAGEDAHVRLFRLVDTSK